MIGSIHPPLTSMRHEHAARLQAPIYYAPPQHILRVCEKTGKGRWIVAGGAGRAARAKIRHAVQGRTTGPERTLFRRPVRASRYRAFPRPFRQSRRAHGAVSQRDEWDSRSASRAHGQDFMVDLGHDELLRRNLPRGGIHRGRNRIQREVAADSAVPNAQTKSIAFTTEWISVSFLRVDRNDRRGRRLF